MRRPVIGLCLFFFVGIWTGIHSGNLSYGITCFLVLTAVVFWLVSAGCLWFGRYCSAAFSLYGLVLILGSLTSMQALPEGAAQAGVADLDRVQVANNRDFTGTRKKSSFRPALAQRLRWKASTTLAHGVESYTDVNGVINALLLGYRTRLSPEIRQSFTRTGTMHIFAISGLHVAILCSVLVFVIGLVRIPRTMWAFALAPAVLFYAFATGSRASAIRAGLMASAYLLAPALKRRGDSVSALALAAILILVWQPGQIVEPGFIFSFATVAGIMAMVPLFEGYLRRALAPDPFLPTAEPVPGGWWRLPALYIGRLGTVSLAAWLTSLPLSMYYFGRFAPIALFANLLVIPLAFLIIVTGCMSLVSAVCAGLWVAGIFNAANVIFCRILTGGMGLLESVPFGHYEGWHLPVAGVIGWYLVLGLTVLYLRSPVQESLIQEQSDGDSGL